MANDSEVRQRKPATTESGAGKPVPQSVIKKEDSVSTLDIFRALFFLVLASCALSYFVTRESFVWNVARPKWTRVEAIQAFLAGPKQYTDEDLKAYDGSNPELPILLAINGTIYDVSEGRRFYGPGGSYKFFSGVDASRGFVTGCFDIDRTPDMRGVEMMYTPKDNPEIDSLYTSGELKNLKAQEKRKAKVEVEKALKHWVDFFGNSKKYTKIGTVKREEGWETKGPAPTLCKKAEEGRPTARARPAGK
ncbi:hypothetical protein HYALB_00013977 [Hymenoscyphus albidus]|uniref:Cytochrome b5 heme-binding domain-containing protein n=1 Tax=Hymenoscyphus albidus TaxID=595503 RepID=A0A9N9LZ56_9HELO|nr:hypothetical protein HYALB_00013977 [Hymenoscyphus albidus]